jgi:anthranilate phosphoribosyltransferase
VSIGAAIKALTNDRRDLTEKEAAAAMQDVLSGGATAAQLAAFLVALRLKGETVDEIVGMARVMRRHALKVPVRGPLVDTCGTGGDALGTFNISTAAAFVAAGAGARVAKHGNRAMSSRCGSADVLEALGAKIDLAPEQVARCIKDVGIGFMFAQVFHPAMKHAAPTRRELGVSTVFNVLGPLTNPAGAPYQVLGVARPGIAPLIAEALRRLGSRRALVVHGHGGLDEFSLSGPTHVHEVIDGSIHCYTVSPRDVGLKRAPLKAVLGGSAERNAEIIRSVLGGERGPSRDIVVLNAAGALLAAGRAKDIRDGMRLAEASIDSGAARQRLDRFIELTRSFA